MSVGWSRNHGKKVTLDIMHGKERTSTGKITSAILVAQHLRVIFCNEDRENIDAQAASTDGKATLYVNGQTHMFGRKV
jgi:hypothetical protein